MEIETKYKNRFSHHSSTVDENRRIYEKMPGPSTSLKLQLSLAAMSRFLHEYRKYIRSLKDEKKTVIVVNKGRRKSVAFNILSGDKDISIEEDFEIVEVEEDKSAAVIPPNKKKGSSRKKNKKKNKTRK